MWEFWRLPRINKTNSAPAHRRLTYFARLLLKTCAPTLAHTAVAGSACGQDARTLPRRQITSACTSGPLRVSLSHRSLDLKLG